MGEVVPMPIRHRRTQPVVPLSGAVTVTLPRDLPPLAKRGHDSRVCSLANLSRRWRVARADLDRAFGRDAQRSATGVLHLDRAKVAAIEASGAITIPPPITTTRTTS